VVEIIFKCTRALDFAFRLGITHRDIKPANILLVGTERLFGRHQDFRLRRGHHRRRRHTQVSGIGSPAYMSPQQVKEQPLNHQTDIYSLGVVMYQLLTGQLPFQASNNYGMIYQIINTPPTAVSQLRKDIPPALDGIVSKAMAKDIDDRYQTWADFAHDLAQAFRNKAVKAPTREFAESEKFDTLRALSFFGDFSDVEIWEVVRFSEWRNVAPGAVIMNDGEPGDFFCFLAEGELKVTKNGKILNLLTAGDCFGEMAIISKATQLRGADVVALTESKIITVRGETLKRASETCRMHFYQSFLEVLANRLTLANQRLAAF
jgi:serine/threonine protein kinase